MTGWAKIYELSICKALNALIVDEQWKRALIKVTVTPVLEV